MCNEGAFKASFDRLRNVRKWNDVRTAPGARNLLTAGRERRRRREHGKGCITRDDIRITTGFILHCPLTTSMQT